jgi:dTDP-4-amino-4,6-dideoxygalactose transaminase
MRKNKMKMDQYLIEDSWDWVTYFEKEISEYTQSPYAIACDSNSNAIRLVLHYLGIENSKIEIPANTYVSVPNQIILSNNIPKFSDIEWEGMYQLGNTSIIDSATAFYRDMFVDTCIQVDDKYKYMILSFHYKKILNIGRGGMILTNDPAFDQWARPMIYDGRDKYTLYTEDEFSCIGWHMYLAPEQAKYGLEIFNNIKDNHVKYCGNSGTYKDLRRQQIYEKYK